jgi:hypothetical protein
MYRSPFEREQAAHGCTIEGVATESKHAFGRVSNQATSADNGSSLADRQ